MYIKFDENGKMESCADVSTIEEIRPSSEGFEYYDGVIPYEDRKYLCKRNGTIMIDTDQKRQDIQKQRLSEYIPSVMDSVTAYVRGLMATNPPVNEDEKLRASGLYFDWQPGSHDVGDIRNYAGQTWECHQAHDNATHPDVTPDNPQTWATFWRPLHGKSEETARPWVKPQYGTTDMYHAGEFMVYTNGKIYRCIADTVYSPEEYAQSWEEA